MVNDGARWCYVVQYGAIWCKMVQYGARWSDMVQDGARSLMQVPILKTLLLTLTTSAPPASRSWLQLCRQPWKLSEILR